MKDIMFRAWDNENHRYFEPTYEGYAGRIEELLLMPCGEYVIRTMKSIEHESVLDGRFDLEEFTGLHDQNGKAIYEGDIVFDTATKNIRTVIFSPPSFILRSDEGFLFWNYFADDLIIVGNIHGKEGITK
jgi:hypothetical protein